MKLSTGLIQIWTCQMNSKDKEQMIWDVYDYYMHPILGYRWKQPTINSHKKINLNELDSY